MILFIVLVALLSTSFPACDRLGLARKDVFVFPENFTGPAIVVYKVDGGSNSWIESESRVIPVPTDGIALTRAEMVERTGQPEFFYEDKNGRRTPIVRHDYYPYPQFHGGKPDTTGPKTMQVYGWLGTKGGEFKKKGYYKYYELLVASSEEYANADSAKLIPRVFHDSVKARIARIDAENGW
jgi:hypothetical protein